MVWIPAWHHKFLGVAEEEMSYSDKNCFKHMQKNVLAGQVLHQCRYCINYFFCEWMWWLAEGNIQNTWGSVGSTLIDVHAKYSLFCLRMVSSCFLFDHLISPNLMPVSAQDNSNNLDRLNPNSRDTSPSILLCWHALGGNLDIDRTYFNIVSSSILTSWKFQVRGFHYSRDL